MNTLAWMYLSENVCTNVPFRDSRGFSPRAC